MSKQFEWINSNGLFAVHQCGTRLTDMVGCDHDHGDGFAVILFGSTGQAAGTRRIDTAMGRCTLADLFGSVQAQILHNEGPGALEAFQDAVSRHTDAFLVIHADARAQHRDCCEAGFRTHGVEHTCCRNETQ